MGLHYFGFWNEAFLKINPPVEIYDIVLAMFSQCSCLDAQIWFTWITKGVPEVSIWGHILFYNFRSYLNTTKKYIFQQEYISLLMRLSFKVHSLCCKAVQGLRAVTYSLQTVCVHSKLTVNADKSKFIVF